MTTNHRTARRPKWGGRHGTPVKGSVKWNGQGYEVTYSFLLGYETTMRKADVWDRWSVAIGQYREHDRSVREREKLENTRSYHLADTTRTW